MFLSIRTILKYLKISLRRMDMFGRKTELTMNKESNYTTICGGVLSLIMTIISVILFISFGSDMVYHQNPTVIDSEIYTANPRATYFSQENFFFMFGVEAPNFTHFFDETIYNVSIFHRKYSDNANQTFSIEVPFERCSEASLPSDPTLRAYFMNAPKSPIENLICIKDLENYYMEGAFDSIAYIYLEIIVMACNNDTRDPSSAPCQPIEMIEAMTEGFFALYTMDYLIDPQNFENPGQPVGKDYFTPLSIGIERYTNRYIATTTIQTDDGFLFSTSENVQSYPTYDMDQESLLLDNTNQGMLMDFIFRKYHTEFVYNRGYKKLQDVLAEIGGFTQILYLIFFTFSYPFISKKYYEKIINLIYNFEEDDETLMSSKKIEEKSLKTPLSKQFVSTRTKRGKPNDVKSISLKSSGKTNDVFMKYMMKIRNKPPLKSSYWEFLIKTFFPWLPEKPIKGNKIKRLKTGEKLITEKVDISYILKKFYEIDKLKMLLFNSNQYHLFEYLPKPMILKNSKIDLGNAKNTKFISPESNVYGQAKKMYSAYRNIKNQVTMSPMDEKLIDLLDDNIKTILDVDNKSHFILY